MCFSTRAVARDLGVGGFWREASRRRIGGLFQGAGQRLCENRANFSVVGNQVMVNLTAVANAQAIIVTLGKVSDGINTSDVQAKMVVLLGDVDGNGLVDGNDVSAVQGHTRQPVDNTNFQYDVNTNGGIDGNDVSLTQGHTRTLLSSPSEMLPRGAGRQKGRPFSWRNYSIKKLN